MAQQQAVEVENVNQLMQATKLRKEEPKPNGILVSSGNHEAKTCRECPQ